MWKSFSCCASELNLNVMLACGQSFRWKQIRENEWVGVFCDRAWTLTQRENEILYIAHDNTNDKSLESNIKEDQNQATLKDYFQLNVNLNEKYKEWCAADKHFKKVAASFSGIRILRQDPVETLFCFICSSNNNIPRITSMVSKLCERYGKCIGEIEGELQYTFPTVDSLAEEGVESTLRKLGFGYRAKYIAQSAKFIANQPGGSDWLYKLRMIDYDIASQELQKLSGVGAKVADCICLMSLDKNEAIPVDTHVYQIARKHYLSHLKVRKSLTPSIYKEVGDCFRNIFGPYAGWAHSVLFSADLKKFNNIRQN